MAEFALIDRLANVIPSFGEGVIRSIGDDAALLQPEPGQLLVAATDTLNEGVHFLAGAEPSALGHKSLAVNLSDLAAMGARPRWALLNLTLPRADKAWVDAFATGFAALAEQSSIVLVGGDTCSGPCSISVTVLGEVPPGEALCRNGASAGDRIMVSGTLGDAALALVSRLEGSEPEPFLAAALDLPEPQLELGYRLRGVATACIDLSDGLAADLGHLARASGLAAQIRLDQLPASTVLQGLDDETRWALQISGGEDYGLCFAVPESRQGALEEIAEAARVPLTEIGILSPGSGVSFRKPDGQNHEVAQAGWDHFHNPEPHRSG